MWLDDGLTRVDYDEYWAPFDAAFDFHPGIERTSPAIREPLGSMTLDLKEVFDRAGGFAADQSYIEGVVRECLADVFAGREIVFLDWQHQSYSYCPSDLDLTREYEDIPVFPNGDYYIHVLTDMSSGVFGHPWQQSLCIWGAPLVERLGGELSPWLPVIRRDGVPAN